MTLVESLGIQEGEMVSLIGAGGKTTTIFRLAKELSEKDGKILVTTTTKMFKPHKPHVDKLFLVQEPGALLEESEKLKPPVIVAAGHGLDDEGKLLGLPVAWLDQLQKSHEFDGILVEADGAASRLLKVPSDMEPVVPELSQLVVWVMAVKVIGKPLDNHVVHRAERAMALLGIPMETTVTAEHIMQLVSHRDGCLKGIPASSRKAALINQADSSDEIEAAKALALSLVASGFERVVITSYLSDPPVKDVILH